MPKHTPTHTHRCQPFPDMIMARHSHSSCCVGDKVYVLGGVGEDRTPLRDIHAFQPGTDSLRSSGGNVEQWWTAMPPMPKPKYDFGLTVRGYVLSRS